VIATRAPIAAEGSVSDPPAGSGPPLAVMAAGVTVACPGGTDGRP
jgi:hypothetical protein